MRNDKRGLSTVVTTLIIILLVIVAIGIIWVVVRGLLDKNTGSIDIQQKCLGATLEVISVSYDVPTGYHLIVKNSGTQVIDGFKYVYSSSTIIGDLLDSKDKSVTNIQPLTSTLDIIGFAGGSIGGTANKVEITPYFIGNNGVAQYCQNSFTSQVPKTA